MELGLSLGDASKPFGFLTDNNTKKKQQKQKQKTKTTGLGFCMALGLNSCGAAGDEEREKAQRSQEEVEEDYGNEGQISWGDGIGSDDNQGKSPFELNLLSLSPVPCRILSDPQSFPWSSDNGSSENGLSGNMGLPAPSKRLDVKRRSGAAEEVSSANSEGSLFHMYTSTGNGNLLMYGRKRDFEAAANDVVETERASSRASDDDDENGNTRKKLRLSKQQSAFLEESFKEHNTLNPKQKLALATQLNLRPRQVEVWFQNRRARTKLKQTEVECESLKKCCETLTEENRRLHKELQELRVLKTSSPYYMQLPATTLTMCPSCERVAAAAVASGKNGRNIGIIPKAISFSMTRPRFYPFSSNQRTAS